MRCLVRTSFRGDKHGVSPKCFHTDGFLRRGDVLVSEQLLDEINITGVFIDALGKTLAQRVCREFAVQPRLFKRLFEQLVCGLPVHRDGAVAVPRGEQWTALACGGVTLPVPSNEIVYCGSAVNVDRDGSGVRTTLDDGFAIEQIADRSAVLVDIANR